MISHPAMRMNQILIEMLRCEKNRGFQNDVVPGGIGTLLKEYSSVLSSDVATRLETYRDSNKQERRSIMNYVGPKMRQDYITAYRIEPHLSDTLKSVFHEYLNLWCEIAKVTQDADQRDRSRQLNEKRHSRYDPSRQRVVTPPSSNWSIAQARRKALRAVLHGEAEAYTLAEYPVPATPLVTDDAPHVELHAPYSKSYPGTTSGGGMWAIGLTAEGVPVYFERDDLDLEAHVDIKEITRMDVKPSPGAIADVEVRMKSINERKNSYGYDGDLDNAVAKVIGSRPEWHRYSEIDPEE